MSNKPPKHSEKKRRSETGRKSSASRFNNGWESGRETKPSRSILPDRHLIVCEGTKTEPNYFEAICSRIKGRYGCERLHVEGAGRNTLSVFDYALEILDDSADVYAHVWLVYDKDGFPSGSFNATADKCDAKRTAGPQFHALWSNEAFELWYILHFEYLQSGLSRDAFSEKLTQHLKKQGHSAYKKNDTNMFELLWPFLDTAVRNAEKLEQANRGKTPTASNPGTTVHHFINVIRSYL